MNDQAKQQKKKKISIREMIEIVSEPLPWVHTPQLLGVSSNLQILQQQPENQTTLLVMMMMILVRSLILQQLPST
jgi:hypothetical protein